jgi:NADPH:quinone reductase-like Zn-dependent oxidoreductase
MKAMVYERYGDPEVLHLSDQPMPKVAPSEVLVRTRCASVNPVDWKIMAGYLDDLMQVYFPVTPGWDVAGIVEGVGPDVPEFKIGDEVMAYVRKDFVHDGTFAEYVTVPVRAIAHKPAALDWEQAAAIPLAGLTAYQTLKRMNTREGETVLIHNASGGVGVQGVQIARAMGARVLGTASAKNHDMLRSLGVEPVEYGDGLAERIRELAPEGVDVVADFIGGVLQTTQAVLNKNGRHASIVDDTVLGGGGALIWVRPSGEDLQVLANMAAAGELQIPIAERFALEDAAEAFRFNQTGHVRGKIIIQIS